VYTDCAEVGGQVSCALYSYYDPYVTFLCKFVWASDVAELGSLTKKNMKVPDVIYCSQTTKAHTPYWRVHAEVFHITVKVTIT
jgi:hypothetical protein